jgi:hypothetical protein
MFRVALVCGLGLAASACAGRDAQPVAAVQAHDAISDCAMINAEIQANNARVQSLASERNLKVAQNVVAGAVGVLVWPVFFAMDAKGAAGTEIDALQARQHYLANLAMQRCAVQTRPIAAASPPRSPTKQTRAVGAATRLPAQAHIPLPVAPEPPEPQLSEADRTMLKRN